MRREDSLPETTHKAALELVRAINENGPKCVGVVIVVVFNNEQTVIPIIDSGARHVREEDPVRALVNDAAYALVEHLGTDFSAVKEKN
jgi:hypothetical protein